MSDALAALSETRATFSSVLDSFSREALAWRPAPDAWSATDVLEHLIRTERGYLVRLGRQIAAGENRKPVGAPSLEAFQKLSTFLRSDRKTRVPEAVARLAGPSGDADYGELRATWDGLDDAWRQRLAEVPDELREAGLVGHPIAGALTAEATVQFVTDHTRHHLHQLNRLRNAEGFPDA
ncbi:MAG: DinB family protein [Bacteroidota bacterium]